MTTGATRNEAEDATRTVVVWCADWPVVAAGVPAGEPAVVLHANRVVACSPAARAEGITRGLRKREAQARCPDLTVLASDPDLDARAFEAVAAAVEVMTPRVEIVRPGVLAFPARAPGRYFGGDEPVAARVTELAAPIIDGRGAIGVGIADGMFAALLAARRGIATVVPPQQSAAFLAPLPVGALEQARPGRDVAELCDLLRRLGLRTLGDVAELPPARLVERFGPFGTLVSRLARGLEERPPQPREIPTDLVVRAELDPPAERVETAAFIARTLASELSERLEVRGLTCTRLGIEVTTEHDEVLSRLWRHEGGLGPAAIADRVRWQLDGWLNAGDWSARPTGGIALLRLVPDQVVPDEGRQLGFWGGRREADERAARGVARLQGLLGPDAVAVPERRGGRGPGERVGLVPAHGVRLGTAVSGDDADRPWPGHLPAPSPAVVHVEARPADLLDADGEPVRVSGRGELRSEPVALRVGRAGRPVAVIAWAGPWPCDERWWDPAAARRRARVQVVLATGVAQLLLVEHGRWVVEATYD
ncbi:MAG: protein ImuB [Actinomycetota bacterium]|nr:protein ImuB [Actinomycetota bacterium]